MLRRRDMIVIFAVLLVAAVLFGANAALRGRETLSGQVDIRVNGALYATVPLGETREFRIDQPNGCVNIVQVGPSGVHMTASSCKNQLCLMQGEVTLENWTRRSLGRAIICLPNRVVVELATGEGGSPAPGADVPDV